MKKFFINGLILVLSIFIGIAICEMFLRFYLPAYDSYPYMVWSPGHEKIFRPAKGVMPGIEGESDFRINSAGLRGDEFTAHDDYRILVLGGSTTECLFLDGPEAWPAILQKKLRDATGKRILVANAGRSGLSSRDHFLQAKLLLSEYPHIDSLLMLAGVNDLTSRLAKGSHYDPNALNDPKKYAKRMRKAFFILPDHKDHKKSFIQKSGFYRLYLRYLDSQKVRKAKKHKKIMVQDAVGTAYVDARALRQSRPKINEMQNLSSALAEYEKNLRGVAQAAIDRGVRPIFMTQPFIWRSDLPEFEKNLLWLGGNAGIYTRASTYYFSIDVLAKSMGMYNQVTLKVCADMKIECIDTEAALEKSRANFYDDCHFNEGGARNVAKNVAEYLLSHKPFTGGRR